MTDNQEHQLRETLQSWQVTAKKDPDFKHNVHQMIHQQFFAENCEEESASSLFSRVSRWLLRPVPALSMAAVLICITSLATLFLGFHWNQSEQIRVPESYQVVIDPAQTARLMVAGHAGGFESISEQPALSRQSFEQALVWIEDHVKLDEQQSNQFQKVHEAYFTKYELLCSQLIQLENKYREFERERIAGKPVDLFSVYANFQHQKLIYEQTIQLQQGLINDVSNLLTPKQQGTYGQLFQLLPTPQSGASTSTSQEDPHSEWKI